MFSFSFSSGGGSSSAFLVPFVLEVLPDAGSDDAVAPDDDAVAFAFAFAFDLILEPSPPSPGSSGSSSSPLDGLSSSVVGFFWLWFRW